MTRSQLVERVWGDRRPQDPEARLRSYFTGLRKILNGTDVKIKCRSRSYVVTGPMEVDLHRFRTLVSEARATKDDDEKAGVLYEDAFGLWRGDPFGALKTGWIDDQRRELDNERDAAQLDRNDVELLRGHHAGLLASLDASVTARPLDERLAEQYMTALYRCGRQAGALACYQECRRRLADELGTDPGLRLRELYQQILEADPVLAVPAPDRRLPPPPVPRQLPLPPSSFIGRVHELTALTSALDARAESGSTVVIVSGTGGIGKTWLTTRWGHDNLARFPDGQLYVDLRGFDPTTAPVGSQVAVRGFLDALGTPPPAIPTDPDAQAALYRSLVAGKRMLVVLDNARDAAQVVPLLPGAATSTVLVTSRHQLCSLVTTHGAQLLVLDILADDESRQLLACHLGAHRVAAESEAVAELVRLCAGLPLALSIVAARAISQGGFPLAVLADEMRDSSARLDALDAGELPANLAAVVGCSYQALAPEAATLFALLGLIPGPDICLRGVASLTDLDRSHARDLIQDLRRAHLVQEHVPDRYQLHDLIHLYAARQAQRDHDKQTRTAALQRLVDFYLHTAFAGDHLLYRHRPPIKIEPPRPGCVPCPLTDRDAAMTWFTVDHANVLAAQQLALRRGWDTHVWQLAWVSTIFHWRRGHVHDHFAAWQAGLGAANRLGDVVAQAQAHRLFGHACGQVGMRDDALDHLDRALELSEQIEDGFGQGHTHQLLAWVWSQRGDNCQALSHATQMLRLAEELGNPVWKATALETIGSCHALLGNYNRAHDYCHQALDLNRRHDHRDGEADTLKSLANIAYNAGDYQQAIDYDCHALNLLRDGGDAYNEADTIAHLGDAYSAIGHHAGARHCWQQALEHYRTQGRVEHAGRMESRLAK